MLNRIVAQSSYEEMRATNGDNWGNFSQIALGKLQSNCNEKLGYYTINEGKSQVKNASYKLIIERRNLHAIN